MQPKLGATFAGPASSTSIFCHRCRMELIRTENWEFHSFVYAGLMFNSEISVAPGENVIRDRFAFADLLRAGGPNSRLRSFGSALGRI